MKHKYLKNVVTLNMDGDACIGCGRCIEVCPQGVFTVRDGKAQIFDRDACMECGACARNCPASVISVDAGVGCAQAIIRGALFGEESCCCE